MTRSRPDRSSSVYRLFKYTIYVLLAYNIWLFFVEDFAASALTIGHDSISWRNVVTAFSATIDTLAWVILLILFELETAIIPDEKLKGKTRLVMSGLRAVCYFFITYSLYGYIVKYGVVTNLVALPLTDICSLAGNGYSYVLSLDEYPLLTSANCVAMQGMVLQQIAGTQIVGTPDQLAQAKALGLTDVINAGNWLIVVLMLETEVWMQLNNRLTTGLLQLGNLLKSVLYTVLLGCALYWGIKGDFLAFWDAFLWLVAFVFIELNVFDWQADTIEAANQTVEQV